MKMAIIGGVVRFQRREKERIEINKKEKGRLF